jgi:hypothetical protein
MPPLLAVAGRAVLWRRWTSLGLLVTATFAFSIAAFAPLWSNAAEDSLVVRAVGDADPARRVVEATRPANAGGVDSRIPSMAVDDVRQAVVFPADVDRAFGPLTVALTTTVQQAVEASSLRVNAPIAWLEGFCRPSTVVGRCPQRDTEVALSDRTAAVLEVRLGAVLTLPEFADEPAAPSTRTPFPLRYRVVGIYVPPGDADPRFAGSSAFDFVPPTLSVRDEVPARGDALLATESLMHRLSTTSLEAMARRSLVLPEPRADRSDVVREQLRTWYDTVRSTQGTIVPRTPALEVLDGVSSERAAVRRSSYLLGLQLVLLACYVLLIVTTEAAHARSNDLALAKLRGLRRRTVVLIGFVEPLVVVALALVAGIVVALGAARLASSALLDESVRLRADAALGVAVLVALVGASTSVGLGLRRVLSRSPLALLRNDLQVQPVRTLVTAEVVLVALAAAALYEVRSTRTGLPDSGIALLAPGLVALGFGVVAARVLQLGALASARRTRHTGRLASFLAARQVGRRRGPMRSTALITVAVALATFSIATWDLSDRLREDQAAMTVGAATVYQVEPRSAATLLSAVRELDPSGRSLAAAVELPERGSRPPVLAVDAPRLPLVGAWRPAWSSDDVEVVADGLRVPAAESVRIDGSRLELAVSSDPSIGPATVGVVATVITADGSWELVPMGRLRFGTQVLTGAAPECADGCLLSRLEVVTRGPRSDRLIGWIEVRELRVDGRSVPGAFASATDWRASASTDRPVSADSPRVAVTPAPVGTRLDFNVGENHDPALTRADVPAALPVVVVGDTQMEPVGRDGLVHARDLSGRFTDGSVHRQISAAPRLGRAGLVMDLQTALRFDERVDFEASHQVWVAAGADPAGVLPEQLRTRGVVVRHRDDLEQRVGALDRGGTALALLLLFGVALAAVVVSTSALVLSAFATGRRRAFEVAALRTAGVHPRVLRRAFDREYAGLVLVGATCGIVSGALTALYVGPQVAVLGLTGPRAPGHDTVSWALFWIAAAVVAAIYATVSAACGRVAVRTAGTDVLAEAPV